MMVSTMMGSSHACHPNCAPPRSNLGCLAEGSVELAAMVVSGRQQTQDRCLEV